MPYYESPSEEAERRARERIAENEFLNLLVLRSCKLRETRRVLGEVASLIRSDQEEEALDLIDKTMTEITRVGR